MHNSSNLYLSHSPASPVDHIISRRETVDCLLQDLKFSILLADMGSILLQPTHTAIYFPNGTCETYTTQSKSLETSFPCSVLHLTCRHCRVWVQYFTTHPHCETTFPNGTCETLYYTKQIIGNFFSMRGSSLNLSPFVGYIFLP